MDAVDKEMTLERTALRVATVAWKIREIRSDGDFFAHLYDLISDAHHQGAEVVVLPEMFCLELLHLAPDLEEHNVPKYLVQYAEALEDWLLRIANSSGMILIGGSHFKVVQGGIQNVCPIAHPALGVMLAPKNKLTRYERGFWKIHPGSGLRRLPESELGVTVCYDSEFPESGRILAESGVLVQCVPAFTEDLQGFQRVRWGCHARATENQNFVVHASLVGSLGREPVPSATGSSAILTPSIAPFPSNAVLGETIPNEEGVVSATLEYEQLEQARAEGPVRNWLDRSTETWTLLEQ